MYYIYVHQGLGRMHIYIIYTHIYVYDLYINIIYIIYIIYIYIYIYIYIHIRQASGLGRVRSLPPHVFLIVYGFTSFIPHGGHLRHTLEGPEGVTHSPRPQLWHWSADSHWPFWKGLPPHAIEFQQQEQ